MHASRIKMARTTLRILEEVMRCSSEVDGALAIRQTMYGHCEIM
jgi:hypothetical protein